MVVRDEPLLLDCTLRDGSYPIQFQFTQEDTARIAHHLDDAGIPLIEVGHGLGINAQNTGAGDAAATDREYIEAAVGASTDADIGVFFIPGIGEQSDIQMAAEADADFIRIGKDITEWEKLKEPLAIATDSGLTTCGNLMKSYAVGPDRLAERCGDLERWGADVIYVVDSAGGMLPDDVKKYISSVDAALSTAKVGFHCHDNLDLAVANTITAIQSGADWVDATLQGIGRSAGNTRTETLATVLQRQGYELDIDQKHLMDIGQQEIAPLLETRSQGPLDITAGYAQFHTKFLDDLLEVTENYDIEPRDLMVAVSERDHVNVSRDLIESIAEELAMGTTISPLERTTNYLGTTSDIGTWMGDDRSLRSSELAERVDHEARKYGCHGVVSITPAFRSIEEPQTTVIHRTDQAVLGNIQVRDGRQASTVADNVAQTVDVVAVDDGFASDCDRYTNTTFLRFDDRGAIARAIVYLTTQHLDGTDPSVLVLGDHQIVGRVVNLFESRRFSVANSISPQIAPDVVLGMERESSTIESEVIESLPSTSLLVDAGIGSFSTDTIRNARERGISVVRTDTRAGYITEVETALITAELLSETMGAAKFDGIPVVAGGVIGERGSVIVDSIGNPSRVFGIADGNGGRVQNPNKNGLDRINKIKSYIGDI
jgi:4-hydroxy-2-oxovalerate aldolase